MNALVLWLSVAAAVRRVLLLQPLQQLGASYVTYPCNLWKPVRVGIEGRESTIIGACSLCRHDHGVYRSCSSCLIYLYHRRIGIEEYLCSVYQARRFEFPIRSLTPCTCTVHDDMCMHANGVAIGRYCIYVDLLRPTHADSRGALCSAVSVWTDVFCEAVRGLTAPVACWRTCIWCMACSLIGQVTTASVGVSRRCLQRRTK
jgi:hypothetical protein